MPETITYSETLEVTTCWCGINVAVPWNLLRHARDEGKVSIFCPLGHEFSWGVGTYEKKYKHELYLRQEAERRAQANRDLLDHEERSHAATRGHLTRTKKRIANGVCPCCNRHFANVERHMKTKHPDYVSEPKETP